MRLNCIVIKGLFGKFDHKIILNIKDKITIIHGPNGYGKTTILKLLNWFFKGEFAKFKKIPFHSFQLEFDDGALVKIYRNFFFLAKQSLVDNSYDCILLKKPFLNKYDPKYCASLSKDKLYEFDLVGDNRIFIEYKSKVLNEWEIFAYDINNFEKIEFNPLNADSNKISIIKDILKQKNKDKNLLNKLLNEECSYNYPLIKSDSIYSENLENYLTEFKIHLGKNIDKQELMENIFNSNDVYQNKKDNFETPDFFTRIREAISPQLIESQRLLYYDNDKDNKNRNIESAHYRNRKNENKYFYAVNICSEEIKDQISKRYEDYSSVSQKLDKTFPTRLVNAIMLGNKKEIKVSSLMSEFKNLERLQNQLNQLELYSSDKVNPIRQLDESNLHPETLLALKLYIDDNRKKLSVFSDLQKKMENFSAIVDKLFVNKSIKFSQNKGLIFLDLDTTIELSPEQLSSGEQHIVVLFFDLLFRAKEGSLILIDEPEISLHVAWQRKFIEILSDIISVVNMDVIVSTHSPSIVHDRMDLTVQLKGVCK